MDNILFLQIMEEIYDGDAESGSWMFYAKFKGNTFW